MNMHKVIGLLKDRRREVLSLCALVLVLLQTAEASAKAPECSDKEREWYRATLSFEEGVRVPFFFSVPSPGKSGDAIIAPGKARWLADYQRKGAQLVVLPRVSTHSRIETKIGADGNLTGRWSRYTPLWGQLEFPLTATRVCEPKIEELFLPCEQTGATPNFSGTWKLQFSKLGPGIAEFEQAANGAVTGYLQPQLYGDLQYYSGHVCNGALQLATFDGSNLASFVSLKIKPGNALEGTLNIADMWKEDFAGNRESSVKLSQELRLKNAKSKLEVAALNQPKYKGKPTVLLLFATWCPSCVNENRLLVELYKKYHPMGLEIVAQTYDLSENKKETLAAVQRLRKLLDIPWEIIPILGTTEEFGTLQPLPQIEGWEALPITVFIRRDGTVSSIHGGFSGPSTGHAHQQIKEKFVREIESLVADR